MPQQNVNTLPSIGRFVAKLAKKGKNNYNFKIDFRKSSRYFWGKIWAWLQPQTPKA